MAMPNTFERPLLLIGLLALLITPLCAQTTLQATPTQSSAPPEPSYYREKEQGWFWYKDPKEEPQELKKPPVAQPPKADLKKQPGSVEWLREQMPILLDAAINDPSKENVEAYMYSQRVAMDKSQRYAQAQLKVVANDPLLDENNRVPLSTFAKVNFLQANASAKDEALKYLSGAAGLWLIFDSKCAKHCGPQADIINMVASKHHLITKFISTDGRGMPNTPKFETNANLVKALGLKITPTTVLVVPPNNYYIVSQGVMAADMLVDRLITVADSQDVLPKELSAKVNAYDRGVLKTEDTAAMPSTAKEWVQYIKDRLGGRY